MEKLIKMYNVKSEAHKFQKAVHKANQSKLKCKKKSDKKLVARSKLEYKMSQERDKIKPIEAHISH